METGEYNPPGKDLVGKFLDPKILKSDGKLVNARGTEDGLVLRLDGKGEWSEVLKEVDSFLNERRHFVAGGEVCLEWLDRLPSKEQTNELEELLSSRFKIRVGRKRPAKKSSGTDSSKMSVVKGGKQAEEADSSGEIAESKDGKPSGFGTEPGGNYLDDVSDMLSEAALLEDDLNTKLIFGTVRSGQRVESPFSLVIVGDVNPGADIVAGGDIIVLGRLRGTAHAGAYDDEFQDSVIIALHMRPVQLRIGSVISRGSDEAVSGAEVAHIEDRRVVVQKFDLKLFKKRQSKI